MSFQVGESFITCCFDDKSQTWSLTVNSTVSFKLHIKVLALLMSRTPPLQCYIHGDEAIQVLWKGHYTDQMHMMCLHLNNWFSYCGAYCTQSCNSGIMRISYKLNSDKKRERATHTNNSLSNNRPSIIYQWYFTMSINCWYCRIQALSLW